MAEEYFEPIAEARAKATYVRIAPRKVQIVLELIRRQPAEKAAAILKFTPKAACEPVLKLLNSAIANAENNHNMDKSRLYVAECNVGQAKIDKRMRPRAKGRGARIEKKSSHISLVLREAE
jgi:large subunit ribosomal protein L22